LVDVDDVGDVIVGVDDSAAVVTALPDIEVAL
jgi:hypothetical protein